MGVNGDSSSSGGARGGGCLFAKQDPPSREKRRTIQLLCSSGVFQSINEGRNVNPSKILPLCISTVPGALIDPNSQERVDTRRLETIETS
ncbi:hypothetical protein BO85DRAFT_98276 [Aspergillus piperis CBS 112811]|uniref:Uncharacterized protein n=1 Tax=Aspergillus piperis CBS 112811 TaxID=1448313 RepID=A0A8G1QXK6_9EURO|nr:hypothetical protein BO85DRAFT_98276 [Aspergillus piperis CBS 112811]RAH54732.1 hypothetical protein BO85DRAFT_98276 [Aspergillus piperis CBS 112811]